MINVDELVAIDMHTHAEVSSSGAGSLDTELDQAAKDYFKTSQRPKIGRAHV